MGRVVRGLFLHHASIAGDRPPRYGDAYLFIVGRGTGLRYPSPCVFLADLITPVGKDRLILTRSGSGEPELQRWAFYRSARACPSLYPDGNEEIRGGLSPALRGCLPLHRRARACPSPCPDYNENPRGGQAPALRTQEGFLRLNRGRIYSVVCKKRGVMIHYRKTMNEEDSR